MTISSILTPLVILPAILLGGVSEENIQDVNPEARQFEIPDFENQYTIEEFLDYVEEVEISSFEPLSIYRVKSKEEFEKMREYILGYYKGVESKHSFFLEEGVKYDCVTVESQPGLTMNDLSSADLLTEPEGIDIDSYIKDSENTEGEVVLEVNALALREDNVDSNGLQMYCEAGTFPMQRVTLTYLVQFESFDDAFNKYPNYGEEFDIDDVDPTAIGDGYEHEYAFATNDYDSDEDDHEGRGIFAYFNIQNPFVHHWYEFSLSQLWAYSDGSDGFESIEMGWHVAPYMHWGSYETRLFIFSFRDGSDCYNTMCGAFVQTNSSIPLGAKYADTSRAGGAQYTSLYWIMQDTSNNWWVFLDDDAIGYYPASSYDNGPAGIKDGAATFDAGGEISDAHPGSRHTRTDMGSGYWPSSGFRYAAYVRNITYVTDSWDLSYGTSVSGWSSDPQCYGQNVFAPSGSWGNHVFFGGSGRNSNCQ